MKLHLPQKDQLWQFLNYPIEIIYKSNVNKLISKYINNDIDQYHSFNKNIFFGIINNKFYKMIK